MSIPTPTPPEDLTDRHLLCSRCGIHRDHHGENIRHGFNASEEPLTVAEVQRRVEEIKRVKGDSERASVLERILWETVLVQVATSFRSYNVGWTRGIAEEALKTRNIEFDRYFS